MKTPANTLLYTMLSLTLRTLRKGGFSCVCHLHNGVGVLSDLETLPPSILSQGALTVLGPLPHWYSTYGVGVHIMPYGDYDDILQNEVSKIYLYPQKAATRLFLTVL